MSKARVFLGGTCGDSTWRNRFIPMLKVDYFNPVVENWTPECMAEEIKQREECDVVLYVITPRTEGTYSIAEAVDDSNKRPAKTVFVRLMADGAQQYNNTQWKHLGKVADMVRKNGAEVFEDLQSAANYINSNCK